MSVRLVLPHGMLNMGRFFTNCCQRQQAMLSTVQVATRVSTAGLRQPAASHAELLVVLRSAVLL